MNKINIGDQVICNCGVGDKGITGLTGTVVRIRSNDYLGVMFEQAISGHDCITVERPHTGRGWFVPKTAVTAIPLSLENE